MMMVVTFLNATPVSSRLPFLFGDHTMPDPASLGLESCGMCRLRVHSSLYGGREVCIECWREWQTARGESAGLSVQ